MGKPTAADLNLGIATAPVLFAAIEVRIQYLGKVLGSSEIK